MALAKNGPPGNAGSMAGQGKKQAARAPTSHDVARLAGVPAPVVTRAKAVLARLEKGRAETGGLAAGLGDLPLFAGFDAEPEEQAADVLRDRLGAIDVDALSPREALDLLYELKRDAAA